MRNTLLEQLVDLELKEKNLKRCLDIKYYDNKKRSYYFKELDKTMKEIKKIKFRIKMERKLKDERK